MTTGSLLGNGHQARLKRGDRTTVAIKLKWRTLIAALLASLVVACGSSPTQPTGGGGPGGGGNGGGGGGVMPPSGPTTVLAAGDIAWCGVPGAELTAKILDRVPGLVLALGDLAYFTGSFEDFARCYEPTWGRHRSRTRPAPGNHDYDTPGAAGYFAYFDALAGPPGDGYYAFSSGGWHILSLNSNVSMAPGSAQYLWLENELRRSTRCALAYWHHPLFSSGVNGDNPNTKPLWDLLYAAGVDVVLNGHDHVYERFLPQSPDGVLDRGRGLRQFTVGTGGAELTRFVRRLPNSAANYVGFGVLKLTLLPDRYDWEFLPTESGAFSDAGFDLCH